MESPLTYVVSRMMDYQQEVRKVIRFLSGKAATPSVDIGEINDQTRALVNDYIEDRLIRAGLNMKRRKILSENAASSSSPSLISAIRSKSTPEEEISTTNPMLSLKHKMPSISLASLEVVRLAEKRNNISGSQINTEDISKVLLYVGENLETRFPAAYNDVLSQLNIKTVGDVNLKDVYKRVAKEIISEGITWEKIVSILAFSGGLATDCILSGSSIYLARIKSWTNEFFESDLAAWMKNEGGWLGFFDHFTTCHTGPVLNENAVRPRALIMMAAVVIMGLMLFSYILSRLNTTFLVMIILVLLLTICIVVVYDMKQKEEQEAIKED